MSGKPSRLHIHWYRIKSADVVDEKEVMSEKHYWFFMDIERTCRCGKTKIKTYTVSGPMFLLRMFGYA